MNSSVTGFSQLALASPVLQALQEIGYESPSPIQAESIPPLLPDLRRISDAWLQEKNTREKGFSLGFFDKEYLLLE